MIQIHIVQSIATDFGGLGLAALRYSQALSKSGSNVRLYVIDRSKSELDINPNDGAIQIVGGLGNNFISKTIALIRYLVNAKFHVLHIHGTWSPLLAVANYFARAINIHVVVSPHGCLEPWALQHRRWKKYIALALYQQRIYSQASMMVATADQELKSIRNLGITIPVAVIANGVDIPPPVIHVNRDYRTLLFLSRIHPKKGLPNLITAWSKIRREGWRIVIAGPDECGHVEELRLQINALGLSLDFEFPGLVTGETKETLFAQADIFILPTHSENFGIAVAEALARGVPVITTTEAPWEDIVKWQCGWWVSSDVDGLIGALDSAMDTCQEELNMMGKRGIQLVKEKYSWDKIGCSAFNAYKWVLDRKCQRPFYIDINK